MNLHETDWMTLSALGQLFGVSSSSLLYWANADTLREGHSLIERPVTETERIDRDLTHRTKRLYRVVRVADWEPPATEWTATGWVTLTELAEHTGLSTAAINKRLLSACEEAGLVVQARPCTPADREELGLDGRTRNLYRIGPFAGVINVDESPLSAESDGSAAGEVPCSRCGARFGTRRVYRLSRYTFCGPCHRWVFANHHAAQQIFTGIF